MAMAGSLTRASPLSSNNIANLDDPLKEQTKLRVYDSGRVGLRFQPLSTCRRPNRVSVLSAVGLGSGLRPVYGGGPCDSRKFSSLICYSSVNARCSEGQTQTVTLESPTITQAPVHSKEKSPELDDGGTGFPPRDDGDGGGGGGGGGGNWSGGFFLFGFLAFLGFLKDKESEEDYRGSRRR